MPALDNRCVVKSLFLWICHDRFRNEENIAVNEEMLRRAITLAGCTNLCKIFSSKEGFLKILSVKNTESVHYGDFIMGEIYCVNCFYCFSL